ncbi:hypothetical protein [Alteromonas lipolytica]|uniref:Uncharacterized protein n=1 Tax=Alteromonas lipolytica TaxID=1856405 RepID=A0A1E8FEK8_9ALTE|nr:hypothetical protein [Alteromonas lipolytica]OFI34362.1 hypothetical protein BFC17_18430 [Alteromonas lipolytica]GGF82129.1 hypothetical protein GCM10011338_37990 [Alteromonas lipolytica]
MNSSPPPRIAEAILAKILPETLREPLLGDLEEEFRDLQQNRSAVNCQLWYWRQALLTSFLYFNQTQKALIMFVISVLFFALLTFFAMSLSGGVGMFFDIPSLILTLPPAVVFAIAVTSAMHLKQAFSMVLSGHVESLRQVKQGVHVFNVLGNSAMWLGGLMTLLGWVAMGSNMTDMQDFGPAFAVSILTFMYALGIKILCYVAAERIVFLGQGLISNNE